MASVPKSEYLHCELSQATKIDDPNFDCLILVTSDAEGLANGSLSSLHSAVSNFLKIDKSASKPGSARLITEAPIPSGKLILSHTGPLNRDYDDVRRFSDAANAGVKRAIAAGCRAPLLVTTGVPEYPRAELVALLGALAGTHVPLQVREHKKDEWQKVEKLGVLTDDEDLVKIAGAIESGRSVCRDVGGSDPERMAPPASAEYMKNVFANSTGGVKVSIIDDLDYIRKEYPCMAAVNRCADTVPRHQMRIVKLEYKGEGETKETLLLDGKGVTMDTGGLDLKVGGNMVGMSRDKCGAAAVGGFFKILDELRPPHLKAIGFMCMVRNSCGAESYSADEIITARSGKRVRVVNTDAEGRMTMLDPLCHLKEMALNEVNTHIFTVATLTGHVLLALGPYGAIMDNGPARKAGFGESLRAISEEFGDMLEVSRLHREDYEAHGPESEYEDVKQSSTKPSTQTTRGHMGPAAFLIMGSGLDEHGIDSKHPIRYTHLDVAYACLPFPGVPNAHPVVALAAKYIL